MPGWSSIIKTVCSELSKSGVRPWRFKALEDNPLLHTSNFLNGMMKDAIKHNKEDGAKSILKHIKQHDAESIESYKNVIDMAVKAFKEIDITDLL